MTPSGTFSAPADFSQKVVLHIDPAFLSPIATFIVGLAVAFIAFQQWKVARHKLRLDLFEKRYKVYEAARQFLAVLISRADFGVEDLHAFNLGTMDAVLLFPERIKAHLDEIRKHAVNMRTSQKLFETLPIGPNRSEHVQRAHDDMKWLDDALLGLPDTFSEFLSFSAVK